MNAALLLLADSRLPAGAHAHSGGVEAAVAAGVVADVPSLRHFLDGRLETAGRVAAGLAWAAATLFPATNGYPALDAEADARMPSPAAREASRAQGRAMLRAVRAAWPSPVLDALPRSPHQPIVAGVAVALAGGSPLDAARIVASAQVTGPASAALRLLGLDPLAVHAMLAGLSPAVDAVASDAEGLPATSAPLLDWYAEVHRTSEVRLFES